MRTSASAERLIVADPASIRAGRSELGRQIEGVSVVDPQGALTRRPCVLGECNVLSQVLLLTPRTVRPPAPRALPSLDPAFAPPVTASAKEIRYAQELRRQIIERYLSRPSPPVSWWCVGVDWLPMR